MARHIFQGTWKDGNGRAVADGTVYIYLAGTVTPANVYAASAGGSPVTSVLSGADGHFKFYVDEGDFAAGQLFKISLSKDSFIPKDYDDLSILPEAHTPMYGELYEDSAGTGLVLTTAGTTYQWVSSTAGISEGVALSTATDSITIPANGGGVYKCHIHASFKVDKASVVMFALFKDNVEVDNCEFDCQVVASTVNVIFSGSSTALINLVAGNVLTIKCQSNTNTTTITLYHVNLCIERIA